MSSTISAYLRSNVLGLVAIFLALSGVTYAAGLQRNSVKSKHIANGQVKTNDLAAGAVDASKVAGDSLGGAQIDESSLAKVPSAASADQAQSAATAANANQLGGQAPSAFQQRVTGTCAGSQAVQSIAANGTVGCGAGGGSGTVTSVGSGTGLAGGPITSAGTLSLASSYRLPQSCTNNQVAKSNGAGVWNCAADTDTNTTYSAAASSGLALTGTAFSLTPCTNGQVLKSTGGSNWACAADNAGGPPTGPAGGNLTGTYPNPAIAANAVDSAKVADNSLTGADVDEASLDLGVGRGGSQNSCFGTGLTFENCATTTLTIPRPSRLLVEGGTSTVIESFASGGSAFGVYCMPRVDGALVGQGQEVFTQQSSSSVDDRYPLSVGTVTGVLAAGQHTVAFSCIETYGDATFLGPHIEAVALDDN